MSSVEDLLKEEIKKSFHIIDLIEDKKIPLYTIFHQENWKTNRRKINYNKLSYLIKQVTSCLKKLFLFGYYEDFYNLGLSLMNLKIYEIENKAKTTLTLKDAIQFEAVPIDYNLLLSWILQSAYLKDEDAKTRAQNIYEVYKLDNSLNLFPEEIKLEVSFMELIDMLELNKSEREEFLNEFQKILEEKNSELSCILLNQVELLQMEPEERLQEIELNPKDDIQATLYVIKNDIPDTLDKLKFYSDNYNRIGALNDDNYEIARYCCELILETPGIKNYEYWFNQNLLFAFSSKPNYKTLFDLIFKSANFYKEDFYAATIESIFGIYFENDKDDLILPIFAFFLEDYNYIKDHLEDILDLEPFVDVGEKLAGLIFFLASEDNTSSSYLLELLSDFYNPDSILSLDAYPAQFGLKTPEEMTENFQEYLNEWKDKQNLSKMSLKVLVNLAFPFYKRLLKNRMQRNLFYEYQDTAKYLLAGNDVLNSVGLGKKDDFIKESLETYKDNPVFIKTVKKLMSK